jgi:IclR family transcriptional regulator, mhp operon transcriptional activator
MQEAAMTTDALEPVRPIRALLRGLEALHALNQRDGLTVTEVADRARLPRTTAYRILETLRHGGFVVRDEMDDRYRPTLQVRGLAEGAESEAWLHQGAAPIVSRLGKQLLWPVGLWTLDGSRMRLRIATDRISPLALVRKSPGDTLGLFNSAAGLVLLAHESEEQRAMHGEALHVERDMSRYENTFARIREHGYAIDPHVIEGETAIAIPVRDTEGAVVAALTLRFIRSALTDQRVVGELLPQLRTASAEVSDTMRKLAVAAATSRPAHTRRGAWSEALA